MSRINREKRRRTIKKNIEKLVFSGRLPGKELALFPTGIYAGYVSEVFHELGYEISVLLDNSPVKCGTTVAGKQVYNAGQYLRDNKEKIAVILCCNPGIMPELERQLKSISGDRDIDYYIVKQVKDKFFLVLYFNRILARFKRLKKLFEGYLLYNKEVKQHELSVADGDRMFINFCPSIGDAYIASIYFSEYIRSNKIGKYVYFCLNNTVKRIFEAFGIENVVVYDEKKLLGIMNVYTMSGEKSGIKTMFWRNQKFRNVMNRTYVKPDMPVTFLDSALLDMYNLPLTSSKQYPKFNVNRDDTLEIFSKHNLTVGKTVILAPHTGTFDTNVSEQFWEVLTRKLISSGYSVCTNCGSNNDVPIKGSVGVVIPIEQLSAFVDMAGFACSMRTGFCDVISQSSGKLAIIYDPSVYSISFFSLKRMGLRDEVFEIYYDTDIEKLTQLIAVYFKNKHMADIQTAFIGGES